MLTKANRRHRFAVALLGVLLAAHSAAREIVPEQADKSPIPLHPGAEKYYREAGLLK